MFRDGSSVTHELRDGLGVEAHQQLRGTGSPVETSLHEGSAEFDRTNTIKDITRARLQTN